MEKMENGEWRMENKECNFTFLGFNSNSQFSRPPASIALANFRRTVIKHLLLLITLLLFSCYSFTATTLPEHIKTVQIEDVDYRSFDPVLGNRLQEGIKELFRINASAVRIVNEEASANFKVTILSYSNRPESQSSNADVETYRVTIGVEVSFYDNVRKKSIYENRNLTASGSYDVQKNESEERHGQERAIENLQNLIVMNALAKW